MAVVYAPNATQGARLVVADVNCQAVCNADGSMIGGGSGGDSTIVGPLGAQTAAASVATVISGTTANGNTTSTTTVVTAGATIAAGALSIEFILYPAFVGTINGAAFDNTSANVTGVYRLDAPPWKPLSALVYTITAGSAVLTVQT